MAWVKAGVPLHCLRRFLAVSRDVTLTGIVALGVSKPKASVLRRAARCNPHREMIADEKNNAKTLVINPPLDEAHLLIVQFAFLQ